MDNVRWTNSDELKYWDVEEENRHHFKCFGFLFYEVEEADLGHVAVQDIKFWVESGVNSTHLVWPGDVCIAKSCH